MLLHKVTKRPLKQQELKLEEHQTLMGKIVSGDIGCLEDGTIVEPLSEHGMDEPAANVARERAQHDDPTGDYRVVLTVPL